MTNIINIEGLDPAAQTARTELLHRVIKEGPQPVAEKHMEVLFEDVNVDHWCTVVGLDYNKITEGPDTFLWFSAKFEEDTDDSESDDIDDDEL